MKSVLLDPEDMHLLREYGWKVNNDGYVYAYKHNKQFKLHRVVMKAKAGEMVDHKNRNPLDNRKSNLRLADKSTNAMNRPAQSNSKSGIKGVSWSKQKNKWRITCSVKGKQYHLGYAKTLEQAKVKYAQRIMQYHGEFSCV